MVLWSELDRICVQYQAYIVSCMFMQLFVLFFRLFQGYIIEGLSGCLKRIRYDQSLIKN